MNLCKRISKDFRNVYFRIDFLVQDFHFLSYTPLLHTVTITDSKLRRKGWLYRTIEVKKNV